MSTLIYNACSCHGSTLSFLSCPSPSCVRFLCLTCCLIQSCLTLQRAPAETQYRVVGEVEDLSRAALWLHCRGSERPRGDRSRGVWLRQQDGLQTHGPDHGCQGDLLLTLALTDTPHFGLAHSDRSSSLWVLGGKKIKALNIFENRHK